MIRLATVDDVNGLVEMGLRFVRETGYAKYLTENPEQLRALLPSLIRLDDALLMVCERDGIVNGVIGALMFTHPLSAEPIVSELFWWVNPEARGDGVRLLRSMETWATTKGAKRVQMIAPTDKVEIFYQRMGYERVEAMYQRSLS